MSHPTDVSPDITSVSSDPWTACPVYSLFLLEDHIERRKAWWQDDHNNDNESSDDHRLHRPASAAWTAPPSASAPRLLPQVISLLSLSEVPLIDLSKLASLFILHVPKLTFLSSSRPRLIFKC